MCEGAVGDKVNDNGCSISTSDLEDLQDKCVRQVNKMTGGPSDDHFDDDHFNDDHHAKDDDKWHGSGDDGYEYVVITCVNQFAIEPLHAILPARRFEKMC